ncbi:uncharacterized protein LOC124354793 isoform X2 [Homalodisca vitripennis]|nr:uncharacterized protein LOC124354793 isoform X2 [Homalodisca vitripennis]
MTSDRVYLDDGLIRLLVSAIRGGTILPVVRYLAIIQQPLANRFARQTGGRMWPEPAASVTNGVFVGTKAPAGLRLAQLPRSQYRRRSGRGEMAASTLSQIVALALLPLLAAVAGQRITTIQLDGTQYFISRMNPYSPELNYFLAYQYCRSIGLQLASFETKEKADAIMQYLINAGYNKYDFWTSGNRLGTDMMIWMSTGLPFNATFDYMRRSENEEEYEVPMARQLSAVEPRKDNDTSDGCILLRSPDMYWDKDDCTKIRDFICEQTRCYYYNYGSIPVSPAQG